MARNGAGVYSLPAGQPVVTGSIISSSAHNTLMADIANALTTSVATDGQTPMTANLPMGGHKVTGAGVPSASGDLVRLDDIASQLGVAFTTGGTSTAYTLTPTPAITAYAAGQSFFVTFNAACGAAPTLAISGVATPPNLVKQNADGTYSNLAALDIPASHRSRVTLLNATQALVERMPKYRGTYQALYTLTGNNTLTSAHVGIAILLATTAGTITLPAANSVPQGSVIALTVFDVNGFSVVKAGADFLHAYGVVNASYLPMNIGDAVTLVSNGVDSWVQVTATQRSFGAGQAWTDVTASRALSTTYTNSTGRPIAVAVALVSSGAAGSFGIVFTINGASAGQSLAYSGGANYICRELIIVPPGATYSAASQGTATSLLLYWNELR